MKPPSLRSTVACGTAARERPSRTRPGEYADEITVGQITALSRLICGPVPAPSKASDVSKYAVERSRHLGRIERVDQKPRVADAPAVSAAHEAPQLPLDSLPSPRRLLLEGAEGSKLALRVKDGFDGGGTESAN